MNVIGVFILTASDIFLQNLSRWVSGFCDPTGSEEMLGRSLKIHLDGHLVGGHRF